MKRNNTELIESLNNEFRLIDSLLRKLSLKEEIFSELMEDYFKCLTEIDYINQLGKEAIYNQYNDTLFDLRIEILIKIQSL
ncbi:hypothetical protein EI427_01320 [Flammeovirga pectinis]|uniref:Uncharacterized protein n=1 Tax=Flammeovirga pectinis TaxID=2494373 RepID=A0A3Q9FN68_9BACT|nr:hypothetical protein [Flammeovirga pectinis]AZQ60899.1 hypothetical protein EI427_01320 [Flammeovirga pectinis]